MQYFYLFLGIERTAVRQYEISSPPAATGSTHGSHTTCLKYDRYGAKILANTTPRNLLEIDCWVILRHIVGLSVIVGGMTLQISYTRLKPKWTL